MSYKERILDVGLSNHGYITLDSIRKQNIPTIYLSRLEKAKEITRLCKGIYLLNGYQEDKFYTNSLYFSNAVFSRRSALYLNGLTNRQLETIEANFPYNQNTSRIITMKCYRVNETLYSLGKTEVKTPFDNIVKTYDKERCICNLFLFDNFDNEEKSFAVKAYKACGIDYDKLFEYADKLGVYTQIKSIFEVI